MQVDELRVKIVNGVQWLAVLVRRAAPVAGRRGQRPAGSVAHSCLGGPGAGLSVPRPSVASDGLHSYCSAFQHAFRQHVPGLGQGRPQMVAWLDVVLVRSSSSMSKAGWRGTNAAASRAVRRCWRVCCGNHVAASSSTPPSLNSSMPPSTRT